MCLPRLFGMPFPDSRSQLDYEDEPSDDEDEEGESEEEEEEEESDEDHFEDALEKLTLEEKPALVAVAA